MDSGRITPNTSSSQEISPAGALPLESKVLGVGLAGAVFTTVQAHAQAAGSATAAFDGIRAGFLVAVGVALVGAVTSAVRGPNVNV